MALALLLASAAVAGRAAAAPPFRDAVALRVSVALTSPPARPAVVFTHELRFLARLTALADPAFDTSLPPTEVHVRRAVDRAVTVSVLAALPPPSAAKLEAASRAARASFEQRARGEARLAAEAAAEGLDAAEVTRLVEAEARALAFLDAREGGILDPPEVALRERLRAHAGTCGEASFETCRETLADAERSLRLDAALEVFFEAVRDRVRVVATESAFR